MSCEDCGRVIDKGVNGLYCARCEAERLNRAIFGACIAVLVLMACATVWTIIGAPGLGAQ